MGDGDANVNVNTAFVGSSSSLAGTNGCLDTDSGTSPAVFVVNGREMVDVSTFNRTMHYFGKQAFLDGYEEGRKTSLGENSPSTHSGISGSPSSSSSAKTPNSGRRRKKRRQPPEEDDSDDEEDDDSPRLKGRKSRKLTGKKGKNEIYMLVRSTRVEWEATELFMVT